MRLASKLVGWDIEIMTAEELDEVIEKAVKAFEKIEVVDTELAERLVEQGILSYDDLSVMEIADLVNTIEGLTEEQAVEIVTRAETLAEEQTEELPRRKGRDRAARRTTRCAGNGRSRQNGDGEAAHRLPRPTTSTRMTARTSSTTTSNSPEQISTPRPRTRFGLAHRIGRHGRG